MENKTALIIFAKAPVPGEVKTRLTPTLDAHTAALLHAALVERVVETATRAQFDSVELCCAPDSQHPFFQELAEDFSVSLTTQIAGDLGARMYAALARVLEQHERVVLVGADCPAFTAAHFDAAAAALSSHDIVLTPADDGGYVLIGARRLAPTMFADIDWGTETVCAAQRAALDRVALGHALLDALWDVDRPEDLVRLKSLKPPLAFHLP